MIGLLRDCIDSTKCSQNCKAFNNAKSFKNLSEPGVGIQNVYKEYNDGICFKDLVVKIKIIIINDHPIHSFLVENVALVRYSQHKIIRERNLK